MDSTLTNMLVLLVNMQLEGEWTIPVVGVERTQLEIQLHKFISTICRMLK